MNFIYDDDDHGEKQHTSRRDGVVLKRDDPTKYLK